MAADVETPPLDTPEIDRLFAPLAGARGVALAVSGGADSVALMRLAADWRARVCPGLEMMVLTVDHALRAGSDAEARQVAQWAADCGLLHETLVWRGDKPHADVQAAARDARYRLLAEACRARALTHLLTAHHLEDQAETLLIRLARGSGVDGLSAMSGRTERFGLVVLRPFLDVSRTRLVASLQAVGQPWIDDPSNDDPRFARVRMRRLRPALAREGMTDRRLADTARRLRRARAALESAASDLHRAVVAEDPAGFCRLSRDEWSRAPEEIGLRVLSRLLMGVGGADYPPRLDRLERLYARLTGPDADRAMTLGGCRVLRDGDAILVCREAGRGGLPVVGVGRDGSVLWDRRYRIAVGGRRMAGLTVRALGADGVTTIRKQSRLRDIPLAAARTAPAVYRRDCLLAAPLVEAEAGPFSADGISFDFIGAARFAGRDGAGAAE